MADESRVRHLVASAATGDYEPEHYNAARDRLMDLHFDDDLSAERFAALVHAVARLMTAATLHKSNEP